METKIKYCIKIDCAACALKVEEALNKDSRIIDANINYPKKIITIKYDEEVSNILKIVNEIAKSVEADCEISEKIEEEMEFNWLFYVGSSLGIIFIILLLLSSVFDLFTINNWILFAGFFISYGMVGYPIMISAWKNIRIGEIFDENFLMLLASIGSVVVSIFTSEPCFEAFLVVFLFRIGEAIQDKAVDKSNEQIASLTSLQVETAHLESGKTVHPSFVSVGTNIVIKYGEVIPLDGVVVSGNSSLDVSKLTGESIPSEIGEGDEVLSGSINIGSVITIKTTKAYEDSTANKIIELVEEASSKKAKSEAFIVRFAKIYTPVVISLAFLVFLIEVTVFHSKFGWLGSLQNSLVFLVSSCPCSLVISIPLAVYGGIGKCSSLGILVKGGNYLEALCKTKKVCFDKTGTITKGNFKVAKINVLHDEDLEKVKFALSLERFSSHPIAKAIVEYLGEYEEYDFSEVTEIPGFGITAKIADSKVFVGNEKLMKMNNIVFVKSNEVGSTIYCAIDEFYLGNVLVVDEIKPESYELLNGLNSYKISSAIITGDKKEVALDVAKKLNITETYYEKLPNEKLEVLEQMINQKNKGELIAYVGDGINDTPSIKLADIGIAIGGAGRDEVMANSDIVLLSDKVDSLFDAIKVSKKVNNIVKQNIIFSLVIKTSVLVVGTLGLLSNYAMLLGVLADVGVCLVCILNSLRVLRIKR